MSTPVQLIGLAGREGAGKDTVADELVAQMRGWVKTALNEPSRCLVGRLCGLDAEELEAVKGHAQVPLGGQTPRRVIRSLHDWGIQQLGPAVWAQECMSRVGVTARPTVVTGVSSDKEADVVHAHGGVVVEVVRPGIPEPVDRRWDRTGVSFDRLDHLVCNERGNVDVVVSRLIEAIGLDSSQQAAV